MAENENIFARSALVKPTQVDLMIFSQVQAPPIVKNTQAAAKKKMF